MSEAYWEHYSHPADIGIRGCGPSKSSAFEQAGLALTAVITELQTIEPKQKVQIKCAEDDDEMLFISYLNTVLYEMGTRKMLFNRFEVEIEDHHLTANILGEQIARKKHNPVVEVKAATFTDLKVCQDENGNWVAQCIVDV